MATKRIYIDGEIIPDAWQWYDEDATSLISVRNQVEAFGDEEYDTLEVAIFSPGGFCFEGWAIHDYLQTLGKTLIGVAYGQCASIATIIFGACSVRQITPNCDFMVHLPWGGVDGNEHVVYAYWKELVIEGDKIANKYVQMTAGKAGDKDAIKASLAVNNHMTGQQAVDLGYATELLGPDVAALQARAGKRAIRPAKAYLRKPDNIPLKVRETAPKPNNNLIFDMANTKTKSALQKAQAELKRHQTGIANLLAGKPYAAMDVNVDGGKVLVIDQQGDEPAVGDPCTIDGVQAPAGDYVATETQTTYTVDAEGKLSAIVPADESDDAEDTAALQVEIENLKAQNEAYKKALIQSQKLLGEKISPDVRAKTPVVHTQDKSKKVVVLATDGEEDEEEADEDSDDPIERMKARKAKRAALATKK